MPPLTYFFAQLKVRQCQLRARITKIWNAKQIKQPQIGITCAFEMSVDFKRLHKFVFQKTEVVMYIVSNSVPFNIMD
jgi:hypothetical protein